MYFFKSSYVFENTLFLLSGICNLLTNANLKFVTLRLFFFISKNLFEMKKLDSLTDYLLDDFFF